MNYISIGFIILLLSTVAILVLKMLFLMAVRLLGKGRMIKLLDDKAKAILLYDSLGLIAMIYPDHIAWITRLSRISKRRIKEIYKIQENFEKEYESIKKEIREKRLSQTDFIN